MLHPPILLRPRAHGVAGMTQTDRLIRYLREHPGASSLEITMALALVNVTGRVSDARAEGFVIECRKRTDTAGLLDRGAGAT